MVSQTDRLAACLNENRALVVKVSCILDLSAYGRITCNNFAQGYGGPPPASQGQDQQNWTAFVNAVNDVLGKDGFQGNGFPPGFRAYDAFKLWNTTAYDQEGSQKPANRRQPGRIGSWPNAWAQVDENLRPLITTYLNAGRCFMNLCEDLNNLANQQSTGETLSQYQDLLAQLKQMVRDDLSLWFTKPTLAALLALSGAKVTQVQAPSPDVPVGATFELSFEAV